MVIAGCFPCLPCLHSWVNLHPCHSAEGSKNVSVVPELLPLTAPDADVKIIAQWALTGDHLTVVDGIKYTDTVRQLKQAVQYAAALSWPSRVLLFADDRLLKDAETVADVGLVNGSKVQVLLRSAHSVLMGAADGTARVTNGRNVKSFVGHAAAVRSACFSADGLSVLTGSEDGHAMLWDAETATRKRILSGHSGGLTSVCFSPGREFVATGSFDQTARIWDLESGVCRQVFYHRGAVLSVAFSPDAKLTVTGTNNRTAKMWDVGSGACLRVLYGHNGTVRSVCFSPDGRWVATGSFDSTVRLWDVETGVCLQKLLGHQRAVVAAAFSPDGRLLVTGSSDATAKVWTLHDQDLGQGGEILPRTLGGQGGTVLSVSFSPEGDSLVTGSSDGAVALWGVCEDNSQGEQPLLMLQDSGEPVWSVSFAPQ